MTSKNQIMLNLFKVAQLLVEQDIKPMPQPNVAATNPMQPLPGASAPVPQQSPETQVVGSSGGQPMSDTGEPLTVDLMIDRFNSIRGGKSFSDPEVYSKLTSFYNALPDQDKVALNKALDSISKIVIEPASSNQGTATVNQMTPAGNVTNPASAPVATQAPAAASTPTA